MVRARAKEPWAFLLFAGGLGFAGLAIFSFFGGRVALGLALLVGMWVCWHYLGR